MSNKDYPGAEKAPAGWYYNIPRDLLFKKYRGAGNGCIHIFIGTGQMLDMDYLGDDDECIDYQNLNMHEKAGEIISDGPDIVTYRVNFSRCTACLF